MRLRDARRWRGRLVIALALAACVASAATAGTSILTTSGPVAGRRRTSGLTLTLQSNWPDGRGYRPAQVVIQCTPPTNVARTLNIVLKASQFRRKEIKVEFDIEIPAGATSVTHHVTLPDYIPTTVISLDVREDGRKRDDLSIHNAMVSGRGMGIDDGVPAVLFVGPANLDLTEFGFLAPDYYRAGVTPGGSNLALNAATGGSPVAFSAAQMAGMQVVSAGYLPADWIDYSGLDVVFLSLDDAKSLETSGVWRALRQWTTLGGNLCIYGVGDDWQGLETIERMVGSPAAPDKAHQQLRGWNEPDKGLFGSGLIQNADTGQTSPQQTQRARPNIRRPNAKEPATEPPEESPFVWKDLMLGKVVAMSDSDPFPGAENEWTWLFNTLGPDHWKWRQRHGLWSDHGNRDFDNFLIADIGLPPVRTYRVLITLFVIAIGPLNYWWLYRRGRLHLLLFTVPAAALVVSAALVGYATMADGFSTRLRARSYTQLDQRTRQSACWSRLSYYSGLSPAGGLVFGEDTAVYPLERPDTIYARPRTMYWDESSDSGDRIQQLSQGWLPSRTPTQYLTLRANATRRELAVEGAGGNEPCVVINRLGAQVTHLLLCDADGKLYLGKDLAPDAKMSLIELADDEAAQQSLNEFHARLNRDPPLIPAHLVNQFGNLFAVNARYYSNHNLDSSQCILEVSIRRAMTSVLARNLAPRSYLAIVERADELSIGMKAVTELQSLHVISGRW